MDESTERDSLISDIVRIGLIEVTGLEEVEVDAEIAW